MSFLQQRLPPSKSVVQYSEIVIKEMHLLVDPILLTMNIDATAVPQGYIATLVTPGKISSRERATLVMYGRILVFMAVSAELAGSHPDIHPDMLQVSPFTE